MNFDASIDLVGNHPPAAVASVRAAIDTLPGAGWISVERCAWPSGAPDPGQ